MKILNVNTYVKSLSGTIPFFIHKTLLENNHESTIVSLYSIVESDDVCNISGNRRLPFVDISRIVNKVFFGIALGDNKHYFHPEWNLNGVSTNEILKGIDFKPDVIIAYWTKNAFNQKILYELSEKTGAPIILFMMDMAAMTGGCHYAYECEGYKYECGNCPALKSKTKNDLSHKAWKYKKNYIEKSNITVIAPTTTLVNQVTQSSLLKNKRIEKIMLSVDEEIFMPGQKDKLRKKFGIDKNKKVIFFGAAAVNQERKGMSYLISALNILSEKMKSDKQSHEDVLLLIAGNKIEEFDIPFEFKNVGYLSTQESLAEAYKVADIFVCPSVEDSGPMMINESIMCGTPVVSFDMGVAPDLVHTGITGYSAILKDSNDLAKGLETIVNLSKTEFEQMSVNCRKLGLKECSTKIQAGKINDLINDLVSKKK